MEETVQENVSKYTIDEWLINSVDYKVDDEAVTFLLSERDVEPGTAKSEVADDTRKLLYADLLKRIWLRCSKVNNTSDSDNGWSHSDGGYTMSDEDRSRLRNEANGIYEELEPQSVFGKKKIRIHSMGVMPAKRNPDGTIIEDVLRP